MSFPVIREDVTVYISVDLTYNYKGSSTRYIPLEDLKKIIQNPYENLEDPDLGMYFKECLQSTWYKLIIEVSEWYPHQIKVYNFLLYKDSSGMSIKELTNQEKKSHKRWDDRYKYMAFLDYKVNISNLPKEPPKTYQSPPDISMLNLTTNLILLDVNDGKFIDPSEELLYVIKDSIKNPLKYIKSKHVYLSEIALKSLKLGKFYTAIMLTEKHTIFFHKDLEEPTKYPLNIISFKNAVENLPMVSTRDFK